MAIQTQRHHSTLRKARLVTCGLIQIPNEDYNETYTPVVKSTSIRVLSAAQEGLLTFHLDVETAFLNGDLKEHILVKTPPGFVFPPNFTLPEGLTIDNFILQLNKALYGLKQASNVWATAFKHEMLRLCFTQSSADDSIFISSSPESPEDRIIVAIYVNNILILANHSSLIENSCHTTQHCLPNSQHGSCQMFPQHGRYLTRPAYNSHLPP
jgi:hypothetical protein